MFDRDAVFRAFRSDQEKTFVPWESCTAEAIGLTGPEALDYGNVFDEDEAVGSPTAIHRLGHPSFKGTSG